MQPFDPPHRLLMAPGPSDVPSSVLLAMSRPVLGHLDPVFVSMMEELKPMLRAVFATRNGLTFPSAAPAVPVWNSAWLI